MRALCAQRKAWKFCWFAKHGTRKNLQMPSTYLSGDQKFYSPPIGLECHQQQKRGRKTKNDQMGMVAVALVPWQQVHIH